MNKELEKLIMTAGDLPAMPVVATKVMQLIMAEKATAAELAKVVSCDQSVAARVLKVSNSAFYGCQRMVQTLTDAIVVLGFSTLKSLVIASSLKEVMTPFGLTEKMLWEHSFGAGVAARIIASHSGGVNAEEAFLAGLLHDIGKIIMNNQDRTLFQRVIETCYNENILFTEYETAVYPFTHAEAGAFVLKKWNFPDTLVTTTLCHHSLALPDPEYEHLLQINAVVSLADQFCIKLGIGNRAPKPELDLASCRAAAILGLSAARLEELLEHFATAYEQEKSSFVDGAQGSSDASVSAGHRAVSGKAAPSGMQKSYCL